MWRVLTLSVLLTLLLPLAGSQCPFGKVSCGSTCATPCDGAVECIDGSDETVELCANVKCSNGSTNGVSDLENVLGYQPPEFKCAYGGCISKNFLCNGLPDCWDGSDETHKVCSSESCTLREFQCAYGACIRNIYKCDGSINCVDKSDETPELCARKRCRSSQFQCQYGACISKRKKCDGSVHCIIDSSDESLETCGPDHTTKAPPTLPPPTIIATPSTTTSEPPPPTPDILHTETPPQTGDWCGSQSLCACPPPNQHFCVDCNNKLTCSAIVNNTVCSTLPAGGPFAEVKVEVLSCGIQPIVNVAGLVRNHEASFCGSATGVPVESVVLADCWGITILAQCRADGLWHNYFGQDKDFLPTRSLCQLKNVNSPVCGYRPRFIKPPGTRVHIKAQPQWPWLVGLKRDGRYICTATIISPLYLLTAGHCVTRTQESSTDLVDVRDLRAQRVNTDGTVFHDRVTSIHLYPGYTSGRRPSHDMALVRIEKEITFSHNVYPACILTEGFPHQKIAATFNRTVSEYTWELIVQQRDPRCHSPHDRCATTLSIDREQFCAIDIDTESKRYLPEGSSGGPYLVNTGSDVEEQWVVAGLVSSSYRQTSCSRPFTIFTSVAEYWLWISKCVHSGVCI